jgi:hypothetical protein
MNECSNVLFIYSAKACLRGKTRFCLGAMINTYGGVVIRLQQNMCSKKIYGGVVKRLLQIMCSHKTTVPKIMCGQKIYDINYV